MLSISVRADVKGLTRQLSALAQKQIPFATATALTATAKLVAAAEVENMKKVLDKPTPFTLRSVRVKGARKSDPVATVYMQDTAAVYLLPFEFGGRHKLIGKGITWLNPKDKSLLNQYGNLPKSKLNALKNRPDVFVGTVKTKDGKTIDGVWQRPTAEPAANAKGKVKLKAKTNYSGKLKLLIRFGDALEVKDQLHWRTLAQKTVGAVFKEEFTKALAAALATAS